MNTKRDPFRIIFPSDSTCFLMDGDVGTMAVVEGDPGVGKTLLALECARRIIECGTETCRRVLLIPMEQKTGSVRKLMKDFFEESFLRSVYFWSGKQWESEGQPDPQESMLVVCKPEWQAVFHFAETTYHTVGSLPSYVATVEEFMRKEIDRSGRWKWDLIIIDNANVLRPGEDESTQHPECGKEGPDPGGQSSVRTKSKRKTQQKTSSSHPVPVQSMAGVQGRVLTRDMLRDFRTTAPGTDSRILLVVEGYPEKSPGSPTEFFSDIVIRLKKRETSWGFRHELTVLKARNQPTSVGVHVLDISQGRLDFWPSPEAVLSKAQNDSSTPSRAAFMISAKTNGEDDERRADVGNKFGILGWEDDAGFRELIKQGDMVLITGPNHVGKSNLMSMLMRACCVAQSGTVRAEKATENQENQARPPAQGTQCATPEYYVLRWRSTSGHLQGDGAAREAGSPAVNDTATGQMKSPKCRPLTFEHDPFWGRNRLFFTLYKILEPLPRRAIIGLEHIGAMLAEFPLMAQDTTFVAVLVKLLRTMAFTGFIEAWSTETSSPLSLNQVTRLVDVVLGLDRVPTDGGFLPVIVVSTAEDRGVSPGQRVRWDHEKLRVSKRDLDVFVENAPGVLVRPNVHLVLPCFSRNERHHAKHLYFDTAAVVGAQHTHLIGITSMTSGTNEPPSIPDEDLERTNVAQLPNRLMSRYSMVQALRRMAHYPRNDLHIMYCEDDILPLDQPSEGDDNVKLARTVIKTSWFNPEWLEPLGTLEEWCKWLSIDDTSFLPEFIVNRERKVIAVPYALDMGLLLSPRPQSGKGTETITNSYSLTELLKEARRIRETPPDQTSKRQKSGRRTTRRLGVSHLGRETCVALLIESMLCLHGAKKVPDLRIDELEELVTDLSVLLRDVSKKPREHADSTVEPCRRSWYSRLSELWIEGEALDYVELASRWRISLIGQRWLMNIRYLIVPRGSQCPELAVELIRGVCCRQYAFERMLHLVGLSPYTEHYTGPKPDFPHAAGTVLPHAIAGSVLDPAIAGTLVDPTRFRKRSFMRQDAFGPNYGKMSAEIATRLQLLLRTSPEDFSLRCLAFRDLVEIMISDSPTTR